MKAFLGFTKNDKTKHKMLFPKKIFKINVDYLIVKYSSKKTAAARAKPLEETVPLNHYI